MADESGFFATLDPDQARFIFQTFEATGIADGVYFKIEDIDPKLWTSKVGLKGAVTRMKKKNRAAKVTLRIKQASPYNKILTTIRALDATTGKGFGPIAMTDGFSNWFGAKAWIDENPPVEVGEEEGTLEWVFFVAKLVRTELGVPQ